jgi:hypothetical protein
MMVNMLPLEPGVTTRDGKKWSVFLVRVSGRAINVQHLTEHFEETLLGRNGPSTSNHEIFCIFHPQVLLMGICK